MKRKTLTTAVMAGLTGVAGMVSVANAVNVNPDGLGQVLLYPYYTARGGNDTLISVVNTTSQGKAVKVRFLEALNSREVLDFNLYLSPFDVWTGAVTDLGNIPDSGYESFGISTSDTSCTAPYFFGDQDGFQEFLNFQYASEPFENPDPGGSDFAGTLDGGPTSLERTASGYIEIIEMGTLVPNPEEAPAADGTDPAIVPYWVEHAGITGEGDRAPRNCDAIVDQWREVNSEGVPGIWETTDAEFGFDADGPSGGLMGSASIIDVAEGLMFSYNATAVDNFWGPGQTFHTDPGTLAPSLASSNNGTSQAFISNFGVETIDWTPQTPQAINAALTVSTLLNEFQINQEFLLGRTEWVLTFPTKGIHTDPLPGGPGVAGDAPIPPFTALWSADNPGSCDGQDFGFWDREEGPESEDIPDEEEDDVVVSPPRPPEPGQPPPEGFQLCREANVVRFVNDDSEPTATEIFGEPLRLNDEGEVDELSYTNFQLTSVVNEGWVSFDFSGFTSVEGDLDGTPVTISGLPVIGFSANTFTNNNISNGVRASFGGTFKHKGTRTPAVVSGD